MVGHNHHFVFSQKLLDAQGCVGGGIVMMEEPVPTLPLFWMFSSQAVTQLIQLIQVKLLIYCLSWRIKALSHQHQKKDTNTVMTLELNCRVCVFFWEG